MNELNIKDLYKIQWSSNDHAVAWVEPTTHCQLHCPKCFRGIGGKEHYPGHRDLDSVKKEIEIIKKNRNVESITLGGGEPLLYPDIIKVIEFCKKINIKVRICTNAIGLDEKLLRSLKKAGTNEVLIHLDRYQKRGDKAELFDLRRQYCDIFRKVGGVNLGFMTMIYDVDTDYVGELIDFYQANVDIIILVSFIFTKDIFCNKEQKTIDTQKFDELIKYVNKRYCGQPSAYIGKIISKEIPSWLVYVTLFFGTEAIGSIDAQIHKLSSQIHRKFFKKHWFLTNKKTINFFKLSFLIFNKNIRKVLWKFFVKNARSGFNKKLNYQIITMNFGPDNINGKWDLCDSCPDAIYYNGSFVPSCLLERIKKGEKILFNNR